MADLSSPSNLFVIPDAEDKDFFLLRFRTLLNRSRLAGIMHCDDFHDLFGKVAHDAVRDAKGEVEFEVSIVPVE